MSGDSRSSNRQSSRPTSLDGGKHGARLEDGGSETWHGDNKSPNNQPSYQGRLGNKLSDSASPAREKRTSGDGGKVNSSAGASKSRFGGGNPKSEDNHTEKSAAVPVFGSWNENDPSSAEDFTMIFTKARDSKIAGSDGIVGGLPKESTPVDYDGSHKRQALSGNTKPASIWTCCFTPSAAD